MSNCPRCRAENEPGRSSCWKCWSPLPLQRPAAQKPIDPPVCQEEQTTSLPVESPIPPATTPEQEPPAFTTTPPCEYEECPPEKVITVERKRGEFAYVAAPAVEAGEGGASRVLGVVLVTTLLLLAAMLYWYFTFQSAPRAVSADEVGRAYLAAISTYDVSVQQQLATEESRGLLLPSWMTISTGHAVGAVTVQGKMAKLEAEVRLALTSPNEPAHKSLLGAFEQPYRMQMILRKGGNGWQVDQRAFYHELRVQLAQKNPSVAFPAWK